MSMTAASSQFTTYVDFVVFVSVPAVFASIAGGNRTVSHKRAFTLDASGSTTELASGALAYSWTVCKLSGATCGPVTSSGSSSTDSSTGSSGVFATEAATGAVYSPAVPAAFFPLGVYLFKVTARDTSTQANGTAVAQVTITNTDPPTVKVVIPVGVNLNRFDQSASLKLSSGVTDYGVNESLIYQWSIVLADGSSLSQSAATLGFTSSEFVLSSGALARNAVITLQVQIKNAPTRVGSSSVSIVLNKPPSGGDISIAGANGESTITMGDSIRIAAPGWFDPEQGPLTYLYSYIQPTTGSQVYYNSAPSDTANKIVKAPNVANKAVAFIVEIVDQDGAKATATRSVMVAVKQVQASDVTAMSADLTRAQNLLSNPTQAANPYVRDEVLGALAQSTGLLTVVTDKDNTASTDAQKKQQASTILAAAASSAVAFIESATSSGTPMTQAQATTALGILGTLVSQLSIGSPSGSTSSGGAPSAPTAPRAPTAPSAPKAPSAPRAPGAPGSPSAPGSTSTNVPTSDDMKTLVKLMGAVKSAVFSVDSPVGLEKTATMDIISNALEGLAVYDLSSSGATDTQIGSQTLMKTAIGSPNPTTKATKVSNPEILQQVKDVIGQIEKSLVANLVPGEAPKCASANNLAVCASRGKITLAAASGKKMSVQASGVNALTDGTGYELKIASGVANPFRVVLPANWYLKTSVSMGETFDVSVVQYARSPYFNTFVGDNPVIGMNIRDSDGDIVSVKNLNPPIQFAITFPFVDATKLGSCLYWNETKQDWGRDGMNWTGYNKVPEIMCSTTHMTDFSIGYQYIPYVPIEPENLIPGCTWCIVLIAWLVYIACLVVANIYEYARRNHTVRLSDVNFGSTTCSARNWGVTFRVHHLLIGSFYRNTQWTVPQRVTALFASIMLAAAWNAIFVGEGVMVWGASGVVSALITFVLVLAIGFAFHHTPSRRVSPRVAPGVVAGPTLGELQEWAAQSKVVEKGDKRIKSPRNESSNSTDSRRSIELQQQATPSHIHPHAMNNTPSPARNVPQPEPEVPRRLIGDNSPVQLAPVEDDRISSYSGSSVTQPKTFTIGQLVATAMQEFNQGNYLLGLHLLIMADKKGTPGRRNPNAGLPLVVTVRDAKLRAAERLNVTLDEIEMRFDNDERSSMEWQTAKRLTSQRKFRHALKSFKAAMFQMNPDFSVVLESSYDCTPWLQHYAERFNVAGMGLTRFLEDAETRRRSNAQPPIDMRPHNSSHSAMMNRPDDASIVSSSGPEKRDIALWKRGIRAAKIERNYIKAAHMFMEVKNQELPPGAARKDMTYGKQWARYYATVLKPIDPNFDAEWERQQNDPSYWNGIEESRNVFEANNIVNTASSLQSPHMPTNLTIRPSSDPVAASLESPTFAHRAAPRSEMIMPSPDAQSESEDGEQIPKIGGVAPRKVPLFTHKVLFVAVDGRENARGTSDDPLKSVSLALEKAAPGTHIVLRPGNYEPFAVLSPPPNLTIMTEPGRFQRAVIRQSDPQHAWGPAVLVVGARGITFRGLRVEGRVAVEAQDSEGVVCVQNEFVTVTRPVCWDKTPVVAEEGGSGANNIQVTSAWQRLALLRLPHMWFVAGYLLAFLAMAAATIVVLMLVTDVNELGRGAFQGEWLLGTLISLLIDWIGLQVLKMIFFMIVTPVYRPHSYRQYSYLEKVSTY